VLGTATQYRGRVAQVGGPIALVEDGDIIAIDASGGADGTEPKTLELRVRCGQIDYQLMIANLMGLAVLMWSSVADVASAGRACE
jgi:dihydroxyacid dehydratase/phosphogluconate dehydratase